MESIIFNFITVLIGMPMVVMVMTAIIGMAMVVGVIFSNTGLAKLRHR